MQARLKRNAQITLLSLTLLVAITLTSFSSIADLMIMPIRTIFTERDKTKGITVINQSDNPATFRFSFVYNKQREDGAMYPQDTPIDTKYDLGKMLVYSPRQVQLGPHEKQAIRLSVRRPENLPDGEYRTYLKLRRIPGVDREREVENAKKKGVNAGLFINIGFAVPIIYRVGKYDTTATIADLKIIPASKDGKKKTAAEFMLSRKGKYSTLGAIKVFWLPPGASEEQLIGTKNNLNIFPEINKRTANIQLDVIPIGGKIHVVYEGEDIDKNIIFDEKTFPVK